HSRQTLSDFGRGGVAERGAEAGEEPGPVELVLLGPDVLEGVGREQRPDLRAALEVEAPRLPRHEPGPERVADARGVERRLLGGRSHLDRLLPGPLDHAPVGALGGDAHADLRQYLVAAPARLRLEQRRLVVVRDEVTGAAHELADLIAVEARELLAGVGQVRE